MFAHASFFSFLFLYPAVFSRIWRRFRERLAQLVCPGFPFFRFAALSFESLFFPLLPLDLFSSPHFCVFFASVLPPWPCKSRYFESLSLMFFGIVIQPLGPKGLPSSPPFSFSPLPKETFIPTSRKYRSPPILPYFFSRRCPFFRCFLEPTSVPRRHRAGTQPPFH